MIGISRNGIEVYDRFQSHLHCSVEDVAEAISNMELSGDFIKTTYQFTDRFGYSECVETTNSDEIIWKKRERREGLSRFVLNREPVQTNLLTVILMRKPKCYVILTAFWGKPSEPEIWDTRAFERDRRGYSKALEASLQFWSKHALVL